MSLATIMVNAPCPNAVPATTLSEIIQCRIARMPRQWHADASIAWEEFWQGPYLRDALLVDIRDETGADAVPGAIHIPMGTFLSQMLKNELVDLDEEVYIFCNTDNRSEVALLLLRASGYTNVRKIAGGYQALPRRRPLGPEGGDA